MPLYDFKCKKCGEIVTNEMMTVTEWEDKEEYHPRCCDDDLMVTLVSSPPFSFKDGPPTPKFYRRGNE